MNVQTESRRAILDRLREMQDRAVEALHAGRHDEAEALADRITALRLRHGLIERAPDEGDGDHEQMAEQPPRPETINPELTQRKARNGAGNPRPAGDNGGVAPTQQEPAVSDQPQQQEQPAYQAHDPLHDYVSKANLSDPTERAMLADALEDAGRSQEAGLLRQGERLAPEEGKLWPSTSERRSSHLDDHSRVVTDYATMAPLYGEQRAWRDLGPDERAAWSDWLDEYHEQEVRRGRLRLSEQEAEYLADRVGEAEWSDLPRLQGDALDEIEAERQAQ